MHKLKNGEEKLTEYEKNFTLTINAEAINIDELLQQLKTFNRQSLK